MKSGPSRKLREFMERQAARGISSRFANFTETEYVLTKVGEFPAASTPPDAVARRA